MLTFGINGLMFYSKDRFLSIWGKIVLFSCCALKSTKKEMPEKLNVDDILAFWQLTQDKSEEEKQSLARQLGMDYDEYRKRLGGKEKEAEFIAIMNSLRVLKHFTAYDEGLSHITEEYTSDFNIEMNDGYQMLLEVKHTDKEKFEISQGNLQNRIAFASRQGIPLRFAVSLRGMWGLFTSELLVERHGKLMIDDFLGPKSVSWLDTELATCSYMFPKYMKIKSVYSKSNKKSMDICFEPYGYLVSYELYCGTRKLFRFKGNDSKYRLHSLCLEELQNRLANSNQKVEVYGDTTVLTESSNEVHIIPEYKFLLAPITHMRKESDMGGISYTAQMAVKEKNFPFLPVEVLRKVLDDLVQLGLEIVVFRNSAGYSFENYKRNFWGNR